MKKIFTLFFGIAFVTGAFAQSGDGDHNNRDRDNQYSTQYGNQYQEGRDKDDNSSYNRGNSIYGSQQGNYTDYNQNGYGREQGNYRKRDRDGDYRRDRKNNIRRRDRDDRNSNRYDGRNYRGNYDQKVQRNYGNW